MVLTSCSQCSAPDYHDENTEDRIVILPPGTRNHIYHLVLLSDSRIFGPWQEPLLFATSKQIRREASPVFYSNNNFQSNLRLDAQGKNRPGGRFKAAICKFASVVELCGVQAFRSFRV